MPMDEHVGRQDYILSAVDKGGKLARDAFEITVVRRPSERRLNHEFGLILALDYQRFVSDVDLRIDLSGKIAGAFNDHDTRFM